ncbi:MAG: YraN family protein [Elusimicrobia bacterium]|nr:YraN family protein [Elusimicrobiota bacterium]
MSSRAVGQAGEDLAARHLEGLGWKILARNWKGSAGELDIVAFDGPTLAFVEVKLRASRAYGLPEEAVSRTKQGRIARAALEFMSRQRLSGRAARFDVAAVESGAVRLIRAAFEAPGWTR